MTGRHHDEDGDGRADQGLDTPPDPPSTTAGEQDHEYPWAFAGEPADAPVDCGRAPSFPGAS